MKRESAWRRAARRVINETLAQLRAEGITKERNPQAVKKALNEAYPFGPRKNHPYRMWREEVQKVFARDQELLRAWESGEPIRAK